ncbi:MAG: hypothetical protein IT446_07630 [Phycisphaerales bacterium]|nr:hypothetical protein [Phycisphaerales bacterium]
MKERLTIRLYEKPGIHRPDANECHVVADQTAGWHSQRGEQIGLLDPSGGFLMAGIESIDPEVYEDDTGRFKLAVVWTLD